MAHHSMSGEEASRWAIKGVLLEGLFGELDHEFSLDEESQRAILIGPNGVGKTKLLTLVKALLNLELSTLLAEPFRSLMITFRSGEVLTCRREDVKDRSSDTIVEISLKKGREFSLWSLSSREYNKFEDWAADDAFYSRKRIDGVKYWRLGGRLLSTDQLINHLIGDRSVDATGFNFGSDARAIKRFLGNENAVMVGADRITMSDGEYGRAAKYGSSISPAPEFAKARYIAEEFEKARLQYLKTSQLLDSTFPARLLRDSEPSWFKSEREMRAVYESLREKFEETASNVGVDDLKMAPLPDRELDEWETRVLTLHVVDGLEKISALDDLSQRIEVFEHLVNSKLVRSEIMVQPEGLFLNFGKGNFQPPGENNLSSGERQQIQMAFDLVFKSRSKCLVLVDEPEISLHVNWQAEILGEFDSLREVNKFQYIVATHSPEIIGDSWNSVRPLTFATSRNS